MEFDTKLFVFRLEHRVARAMCGGRYKQRDGRERWRTLRAVGSAEPVTSTIVFGLLPVTTYQFMVLARNRLGDGLFSNIVVAVTTGACSLVLPLTL